MMKKDEEWLLYVQKVRDEYASEISDYRNTLFNCLTQFEFYVDATEFKDSGNAAIKHIQQLLLKYE